MKKQNESFIGSKSFIVLFGLALVGSGFLVSFVLSGVNGLTCQKEWEGYYAYYDFKYDKPTIKYIKSTNPDIVRWANWTATNHTFLDGTTFAAEFEKNNNIKLVDSYVKEVCAYAYKK